MTAEQMRRTDLRRWNLVQGVMLTRLGLATEVDRILDFGLWFARTVDQLGHLPRYRDAEAALAHLNRNEGPST